MADFQAPRVAGFERPLTVLTRGHEAGGTYLIAVMFVPPADVVHSFGKGGRGDKCKVSRQYVFRKGDLIFTLYDWKSTNLCEPALMSPEEFWSLRMPTELHIGTNSLATPADVKHFAEWLIKVTSESME